jgi:hypothetical protein
MGDAPSDEQKSAVPQIKRRFHSSVRLDRAVLKAAAEIRAKYAELLSERVSADRVARLFRVAIFPRRQPGRKLSESVEIALPMRQTGDNWQNIYAAALPGFRALDKYERLLRCTNLRRNVNKALRRRAAKTENSLAPV